MADNIAPEPTFNFDEWYANWQESPAGQWYDDFHANYEQPFQYTWEQESQSQQATVPFYEDVGGITRFFMDRLPGWTQTMQGWSRYVPDWAKEGYEGIKPVIAPIFKIGMEALDIFAEGLERVAGMGVQALHASETGTLDDFTRNIDAAWKASHWTWNVLGNDALNWYYDEQTGQLQKRIESWTGPDQVARLRKMYIDGATHEQVDEAMMNDYGALWFRGAMWDAIGHIFVDPMCWGMAPKVMSRASKWADAAIAGAKYVDPLIIARGEELLAGAATDLASAEKSLAELAVRGLDVLPDELNQAEQLVSMRSAAHTALEMGVTQLTGKGPKWYEKLILQATNHWAVSLPEALEDTFRVTKPWTWFNYTKQSKQTEVLYKAVDTINHAISGAEDVEDAMKVVDQMVSAILNPQVGTWIVSPAARSLQSVVMQTTAWFTSLQESMNISQVERFVARMLGEVLETDVHKVIDLLKADGGVQDVLARLGKVAESVTDESSGVLQLMKGMLMPAEGAPAALDAKRLQDVLTMFADGKVPIDMASFKLELITRMGTSIADSLILSGGVDAAGTFQKATAMLKSAETLAFLRTNPGYLFRNFFNNEISQIATGTFGFAPGKQFWDEGFWLKAWERMDVMAPSRLRSGMTMAQVQDLERADTSIKAALKAAEDTLNAARRGDVGWMDKVTQAFSDINLGKLDAGMWSSKAESWASLRSYTIGMEKARSELAIVGKGLTDVRDHFTKVFPSLDPDLLPRALTGAIHSSLQECRNAKEIRAALFDYNLNANWGPILEKTAARMGVNVDMINDFVGVETRMFLEDAIMSVVRAGGGEEDLNYVLWQTHNMVQKHLDDLIRAGGDPIAQQTLAMLKHNQPHVAMVHLYGRQLDEYYDAYAAHRKATDAIMGDIRKADMTYDQTRAAHRIRAETAKNYWDRISFRQEARAKAIQAAIDDGARIDSGLQKTYQKLHQAYDDFFTSKNKALDDFFGRKPKFWEKLLETKGVTRAEEWDRIQYEINKGWQLAENNAQRACQQIDRALIAQLEATDPSLGVFAEAWRNTVRDLRTEQVRAVDKFYIDDVPNRPTDPNELTAFYDKWSSAQVQHQNLVLQAEREGLDSLSTGLPFGMNHKLSDEVRNLYLQHLVASQDQGVVRELMDFVRSENNPDRMVMNIAKQLEARGMTLSVEANTVKYWGQWDYPNRVIRLKSSLLEAARGDEEAIYKMMSDAEQFLADPLSLPKDALDYYAQFPGRAEMLMSGDHIGHLREIISHELVHVHQDLATIGRGYSAQDPLFFRILPHIDPTDIHYGNFSPIFQKLYADLDVKKMTDADWLDFYKTLNIDDEVELIEFQARLVSYRATHPADAAQYYLENPQLLKYADEWLTDNPTIINALNGRGRFAHSRTPMAIPPQAITKQSKMMAQEIYHIYQNSPSGGGSYSPYYLRNMQNTDGYAVVIHKGTEKTLTSEHAIQGYINQHADLLADPRNMVGFWRDPDTGLVNLEVSTLVGDRAEAIRLGKTYGQQAIYDLRSGEMGLMDLSKQRGRWKLYEQSDTPLDAHNVQLPGSVAGPPPTGPAMDFAYYQRLVPEMFQPGGGLDTLWASDGSEFLNSLRVSVKQQMDLPPLRMEDEIAKLPAQYQGRVRMGLRSYADNAQQEMRGINLAASQHGEWVRDVALLNYHKRTYFDHYSGMIFPFSFWTTHSVYKWFWFSAIEKPYIVADWYRINQALTQHGTAKLPSRFNGMVPLGKLPFLPDWMGDFYINPIKGALPFDFWADPIFKEESRAVSSVRRAERILKKGLDSGEYDQQSYDMAMNNQAGPAWEDALGRAKAETDEGYDPIETLAWMVAPHAPIMWGYHAMRGEPEKIGPFLPATRTIKGISAMLGAPHGGVNIEAWMREQLGLPKFDQFDDYRVDRMLSNMVASGEISHPDAMRAMEERSGNTWFDIAESRAGSEYGVSALASMLGMSARTYPPGEEQSRELVDGLYQAYEKENAGEQGVVNRYFDDHPEVATRLALFDDKDTRLQKFLISEVWDKYMNMPSLHKQAIREEFGEQFQYYFLNSETRAEEEIPIEMLAVWLKLLGGDPPGTLKEADQVPPLPLADPRIAKQAQVFYDTRERDHPNWFDLQSRYYDLEEGSQARRDFRNSHPELVSYWNWRKDWMLKNPTVTPYLTDNPPSYESAQQMEEAYQQEPRYSYAEWSLLLPPAVFIFVDRAMKGQSMPIEAREELTFIAQGMGLTVEGLIERLHQAYDEFEIGY